MLQKLLDKYRSFSLKHRIGIAFGLFILLFVLLPGGNERAKTSISTNDNALVPGQKQMASFPIEEKSEATLQQTTGQEQQTANSTQATSTKVQSTYEVVKVVDGDTIDVSINENVERIRLIGINTPETVDPRKPVECFGVEASNKAKAVLTGKRVSLETDSSQGDTDKYGRSLRYVFLEDGTNFNLLMIKEGYAYEYTYDLPYKYQSEFKQAEKNARDGKIGLWGDVCQKQTTTTTRTTDPVVTPTPTQTQTTLDTSSCTIKGNISSSGEKIYHVIGCASYGQTKIDESKGERWFCTEQEALAAGWRKALNCPK